MNAWSFLNLKWPGDRVCFGSGCRAISQHRKETELMLLAALPFNMHPSKLPHFVFVDVFPDVVERLGNDGGEHGEAQHDDDELPIA